MPVGVLDKTIIDVGDYLNGKIPQGVKVAFVSAQQTLPVLSGYIIDRLIEKVVNDKAFSVVDRSQLDAIRLEQEFQMSGAVNDSTVQSIGRILGVKTIVTVAISQAGSIYLLGVRALEVESAQIQGQINRNIPSDPTLDALAAAQPAPPPAAPARTAAAPAPAPPTTAAAVPYSATTAQPVQAQPATNVPTAPAVPAGAKTPPGSTLAEQLAYIESQTGRGTVYDIVVNRDVEVKPMTISTMGRDITVIVRSADPKNVRTIELDVDHKGSLFSIDANVTLILQDIVLQGHRSNDKALLFVSQGTKLILNSGAKITGNSNTNGDQRGGAIHVARGVLELNNGSEISGNTVNTSVPAYSNRAETYGGGIFVADRSVVNIRGGMITENTAHSNYTSAAGGGIYVTGNSTLTLTEGSISKNNCHGGGFGVSTGGGIMITGNSTATMTGGIIAGNHAVRSGSGGGVYVSDGSSFVKKTAEGGDVSGVIYGATGQNANTATKAGSAVYCRLRDWEGKIRNTTLSAYDEISTASSKGWE